LLVKRFLCILLFNGKRSSSAGVKRPGRVTDNPPSSAEVKKERIYTYTPHGVDSDNFAFHPYINYVIFFRKPTKFPETICSSIFFRHEEQLHEENFSDLGTECRVALPKISTVRISSYPCLPKDGNKTNLPGKSWFLRTKKTDQINGLSTQVLPLENRTFVYIVENVKSAQDEEVANHTCFFSR
jgi:hypothetical protein